MLYTLEHMQFTNRFRPLSASDNDARLQFLMAQGWLPPDEDEGVEPVPTTVRLSPDLNDDLKLIADMWNEAQKFLGRQRTRTWRRSSVMERYIEAGVSAFWQEMGGRPAKKSDREELARSTVERLKKPHNKK